MKFGSMVTGRYSCLVVSPSPDKIIIVGGVGSSLVGKLMFIRSINIVEECNVTQ